MNFLNISTHLFLIIILSFQAWASEPIHIDKKYNEFYQVFYAQKNQDENKLFLSYKSEWRAPKARKQRIYNYLGLIDFELRRNNFNSATILLKKMPPGLKYFTVEQKSIYDLIRAEVFFAKGDYARTVLLLNATAYEKSNIYFNKISILYMKSLVHLNLKFEAIEYFEKNSHLFESNLNWDDYNALAVQVSAFLVDSFQYEKALFYLKKPLIYFPLYHSGHIAMGLLTKIECSGYSMGEQFHTEQNKALLEQQIFNRIGTSEYAKNFVLALANADSNSNLENENLLTNLKILVSARQYNLAKNIVDYLAKTDFKQDEILFYKGRIYNSLNQPNISVESYEEIIEKYPQSQFFKMAKLKYAISLLYAREYKKGALYVAGNSLFSNLNEAKFYEFWLYYLGKDFNNAYNILNFIQSNSMRDNFDYVKSTYWKSVLSARGLATESRKVEKKSIVKSQENIDNIAKMSRNFPYPIFLRQSVSKRQYYHSQEFHALQTNFQLPSSFRPLGMSPKNKLYLLSELVQAHLNEFAKFQIRYLLIQNLTNEEQEKIAYYSYLVTDYTTANKLVRNLNNFDVKNLEFDKLPEEKKNFYYLNYPLAYWSHINRAAQILNMNPYWILSVMRAESLYDPNAESSVGAIGLMQIMPYTGIKILNSFKMSNIELTKENDKFSIAMLRDPDKSILFSAWYLKILLDNYNGNYALATAAYNAGPMAINRWLKQYPSFDTAEFLENIPYIETKKYVSNILGNMDLYTRIYNKHPLLLDFNVNKSLEGMKPEDLF